MTGPGLQGHTLQCHAMLPSEVSNHNLERAQTGGDTEEQPRPHGSGVGKGVAEEVIYFLAIGECSAPKAPGGEAQENQSAHCAWG